LIELGSKAREKKPGLKWRKTEELGVSHPQPGGKIKPVEWGFSKGKGFYRGLPKTAGSGEKSEKLMSLSVTGGRPKQWALRGWLRIPHEDQMSVKYYEREHVKVFKTCWKGKKKSGIHTLDHLRGESKIFTKKRPRNTGKGENESVSRLNKRVECWEESPK